MADNAKSTIAAATAAGYTSVTITKPDGTFRVELEKRGIGAFEGRIRAAGEGATLAAASTAALAALNGQRQFIYGKDTTKRNKDPRTGVTFTADDV